MHMELDSSRLPYTGNKRMQFSNLAWNWSAEAGTVRHCSSLKKEEEKEKEKEQEENRRRRRTEN